MHPDTSTELVKYRRYGHTYGKSMDQPGKVANPARGQLNRENDFFCFCSRLRFWSCETGSAAPFRVRLLIYILRLNLVDTLAVSIICT